MRIVFWQNLLSFYQVPHITSLAAQPGIEVVWVVEKTISPDRIAQGWKVPEVEGVEVVVAPDAGEVRRLIACRAEESFHIFSGIHQKSLPKTAFYQCLKTKAQVGLLTEPPFPGRLRDRLSPLVHGVHRWFFGKRIRAIFAIGPEAVKFYRSVGYSADAVFAYGYFPAAPTTPIPDRPSGEGVEIVYLGQLIERKGVDVLLYALAALTDLNWRLTLIGSGDQREALTALAKRLGLENRLVLHSALENAVAMDLVAQSDLFVLPSRHDGWGVVVNEALLRGVPVICSDHCGAADLLGQPWRGETFVSESVPSLVEVLRRRIEQGRRRPEEIARLRSWSRCIEGESVGAYLLQALRFTQAQAPRPRVPWRDK